MSLSRRSLFLAGAGAGLASMTWPATSVRAAAPRVLRLESYQIEIAGRAATRFRVVQPDGTEGLALDEGDEFDVRVENTLTEPSGLHWHGLVEPWRQDGVPYLSAPPIEPGGSADYRFPALPTGTRWMHSHFGLQEQNLLAAPLIIREASAIRSGIQEVVILLEDFSWRSPEEILAGLRNPAPSSGGMAGMQMPGMQTSAMPGMAMPDAPSAGTPMAGMAMSGPDLNDVEYDHFLANRRTLDDPDVVEVEKGSEVRLRIINASASTNFTIDVGPGGGSLLTVDGSPVQPVSVRQVPLATAQRADILVRMPADGSALPILALVEGRNRQAGIVLRPKGAPVSKLGEMSDQAGPRLTLDFEATLRTAESFAAKPADRTVPIDLTGDMARYAWFMQVHDMIGLPVTAERGERVEITMRNTTGMAHPMHLHGHVFQVVAIDGKRFAGAVRDTVLVTPNSTVTIAFDADNPGLWAFHCHNLYHMAVGMFTTLVYRGFA
mgnify:CR=1 FL=1